MNNGEVAPKKNTGKNNNKNVLITTASKKGKNDIHGIK